MECLSDFGTVSFFSVNTLTTGIYNSWLSFDERRRVERTASGGHPVDELAPEPLRSLTSPLSPSNRHVDLGVGPAGKLDGDIVNRSGEREWSLVAARDG